MTDEVIKDFCEYFRPQEVESVIGNERVVNEFISLIKRGKFRPILLVGPKGIGKTTLCKIAVRMLFGDKPSSSLYKEINASNSRKVDDMRNNIVPWLETKKGLANDETKLLFFDELKLTQEAMEVLKTPLETTKVLIIATTNYYEELLVQEPAFIDRFTVFRLNPVKSDAIVGRLKTICDMQKIKYEEDALLFMAEESGGSVRNAIDQLQKHFVVYGSVESKNIEKYNLAEDDIKGIYQQILRGEFLAARTRTFTIIRETNMTGRTFLRSLNRVITKDSKINELFIARFCYEIGMSEFRIMSGGELGIQLDSLLGKLTEIASPIAQKLKESDKNGK